MVRFVAIFAFAAVAHSEPERLYLRLVESDLQDALHRVAGKDLEIDHELVRRKITLRIKGLTREEAIAAVLERAEAKRIGERVVPLWQHQLLRKLDHTSIGLGGGWNGRLPLRISLIHIGAHCPTVIDPMLPDSLLAAKPRERHYPSLRAFLNDLIRETGLVHELRWGVVFVATPERLIQLPVTLPQIPKPTLRVKFPGRRPTAGEWLKDLTRQTKVPHVMAQDAPASFKSTRIRLPRNRELTHAQALAVALYPLGWCARTKAGRVELWKPE